jgi:hypothetical protein
VSLESSCCGSIAVGVAAGSELDIDIEFEVYLPYL